MNRFFFCFIIVAGFLSCHNNETPIIDSNLKLFWSIPLKEQSDIYKFISIKDDVIYDNGIVTSSVENGKRSLIMVDLATKDIRWTWSDFTQQGFAIDRAYQTDKFLVLQIGHNGYAIDLSTGKTVFNINRDWGFYPGISGIENHFYIGTFDDKNGYEADLYKGNIITGEIKKYLTPDYAKEFPAKNPLGRLMYKCSFTIYQGDSLLFLPYAEPNPPYDIFPKMGLYNMTKNKWLYQNKRIVDPGSGYNTMQNGAKILNGRIYIATGHDIVCFDLLTGNEIWRRNDFLHEFPFAFFGYEIFGDKLFTNTEEGKLYAIDINTGQNIWTIKSSGPNSFIRHHNGVLYFITGGAILAVNAETGGILATMYSPDDSSWQNRVVVAPQPNGEKAKIAAFTHKNMYVYEAIR
jgi:outer membrane protein assembly factor BamB